MYLSSNCIGTYVLCINRNIEYFVYPGPKGGELLTRVHVGKIAIAREKKELIEIVKI